MVMKNQGRQLCQEKGFKVNFSLKEIWSCHRLHVFLAPSLSNLLNVSLTVVDHIKVDLFGNVDDVLLLFQVLIGTTTFWNLVLIGLGNISQHIQPHK